MQGQKLCEVKAQTCKVQGLLKYAYDISSWKASKMLLEINPVSTTTFLPLTMQYIFTLKKSMACKSQVQM